MARPLREDGWEGVRCLSVWVVSALLVIQSASPNFHILGENFFGAVIQRTLKRTGAVMVRLAPGGGAGTGDARRTMASTS